MTNLGEPAPLYNVSYRRVESSPPEAPAGRWMAWAIIVLSVSVIAGITVVHNQQVAAGAVPPGPHVTATLEVLGRYDLGARSVTKDAKTLIKLPSPLNGMDEAATSTLDHLAVAVMAAEVDGSKEALRRLEAIDPQSAASVEAPAVRQALLKIYSADGAGRLTAGERAVLSKRLGWFGQLALAFGKQANDPERIALTSAAKQTCLTLLGASAVLVATAAVGFALSIVSLVLLIDRKLTRHYRPGSVGAPYLQAFAWFIGIYAGADAIIPSLPAVLRNSWVVHLFLGLILPTGMAIVWPLIRGQSFAQLREALGWHAGKGLFREIGLGVVGYLAGLPILFVGFIATLVLLQKFKSHAGHPIEQMLGGSTGATVFVYVLAAVWAPLSEETLFRGAFFQGLRSRRGWIVSALITSLVFAAIHPQGWTTIPALMSIAIVFAAIREWRGTIFASAAAHAIHNAALVTLVVLALG